MGVSLEEKILFSRHTSVMLKSGLSLAEAVSLQENQTQNPSFRKILDSILKEVQNGQSFEKALNNHKDVFDPFYIAVIRIGEKSGKLDENLSYLGDELTKNNEFRRKIRGALLYPALVLIIAIIVGMGISIFVLPQLTDLFTSLDVDLPLSTRILIAVSTFMKNYGVLAGLAFVGMVAGFLIFIRSNFVKPVWDRIALRIPFIGKLIQYSELVFMFKNLGVMLKSGLTITESLETTQNATTNYVYKKYLQEILKKVLSGKSLYDTFVENKFKYIPPIVISMIAVGEKSGTLENSFEYLSDYFTEEVDVMIKDLPVLLEPIALLIIGIIVAFLALAIITPIYQFTGSIHR